MTAALTNIRRFGDSLTSAETATYRSASMPAFPIVTVTCPHCRQRILESARLVRPLGEVYCPDCGQTFLLDDADEAMRRQLDAARDARLRRKAKVKELRQRWSDPAPTDAELDAADFPKRLVEHPRLIGDVLLNLDRLLDRLNAERTRGQDKAA
jgi:uncharacterized Zn finger protein (UPF0148 family)